MRGKIRLQEQRSLSERLSDSITHLVGSWTFLLFQTVLILSWVFLNIFSIIRLDPFPFIFLNLFLSFQAAYTAPIIMMSQNRQGERDRKRAEADYEVNLLAEREVSVVLQHLEELQRKHRINGQILYELNQIKKLLAENSFSEDQIKGVSKEVVEKESTDTNEDVKQDNLSMLYRSESKRKQADS